MKKDWIKIIVITVLFVIIINLIANYYASKIETEQLKYKSKMGKTIILEKDTLTIIDYSILSEDFTLSNGKKVNSYLVFKDSIKN